jgi:hypothetical protein
MERVRGFTISREGIGFLKAILESYEEVALMTVLDGRRGDIELIYPSTAEDVVKAIMEDMRRFNIMFADALPRPGKEDDKK